MKKLYILLFLTTSIFPVGEKVPFFLLKRLLPDNPIIVEAGAQFGEDTSWMSEMWPKGIIHAFEPLPASFEKLERNTKKYKNVYRHQLALSNKAEKASFYVDGHSGGASSLLRPTDSINKTYFHADLNNPISVECITLDNWAKKNNINKIDFLWLDMEGNELRALQASTEILKTVKIIYTEVNLQEFWHGCVQYKDLKKWLEGNGFKEIWSDIVPKWHGNVLFVKD